MLKLMFTEQTIKFIVFIEIELNTNLRLFSMEGTKYRTKWSTSFFKKLYLIYSPAECIV